MWKLNPGVRTIFPNCLKTQKKQAIKQKKQTCAMEARNKEDSIPSGFPSTP